MAVPARLHDVAEQLKKGESPRPETVRSFLGWFGAERRGYYIVLGIRSALKQEGVQTVPDFESAYIDAVIEFRLVEPPPPAPPTEGSVVVTLAPATL